MGRVKELRELIDGTKKIIQNYETKLEEFGGRVDIDPCLPCTSEHDNQYKLSWNLYMNEQTMKSFESELGDILKNTTDVDYVKLKSELSKHNLRNVVEAFLIMTDEYEIYFDVKIKKYKYEGENERISIVANINIHDTDIELTFKDNFRTVSSSSKREIIMYGNIGYRDISKDINDYTDTIVNEIRAIIIEAEIGYTTKYSNCYALLFDGIKYIIAKPTHLFSVSEYASLPELIKLSKYQVIRQWHRNTRYSNVLIDASKFVPFDKKYFYSKKIAVQNIKGYTNKELSPRDNRIRIVEIKPRRSTSPSFYSNDDLEFNKTYNIYDTKGNDIYVNAGYFIMSDDGDVTCVTKNTSNTYELNNNRHSVDLSNYKFVDYDDESEKGFTDSFYSNSIKPYNEVGRCEGLFRFDENTTILEKIQSVGKISKMNAKLKYKTDGTERLFFDKCKGSSLSYDYHYRNETIDTNVVFPINSVVFDKNMKDYRVSHIEERYVDNDDKPEKLTLVCYDKNNEVVRFGGLSLKDGFNLRVYNDESEIIGIKNVIKTITSSSPFDFYRKFNAIKQNDCGEVADLMNDESGKTGFYRVAYDNSYTISNFISDKLKEVSRHTKTCKCECGGRYILGTYKYECTDKYIGCKNTHHSAYCGEKCSCGSDILKLGSIRICESFLDGKCNIEHICSGTTIKDENWNLGM